jgi:hypothetical protein
MIGNFVGGGPVDAAILLALNVAVATPAIHAHRVEEQGNQASWLEPS